MLPCRLQVGLDQDLSNLPFVRCPEAQVGPKRFLGTVTDLERDECTVLDKSVDSHVGILQRNYRSDCQMADVEVVTTAKKDAEFTSIRPNARPS